MSSPVSHSVTEEMSPKPTLEQIYASKPHVLQPGERRKWDQNMVYYAASRVRAACSQFAASERFGQKYDEWWMSRIEGELAGSYGSSIMIPRLLRELQKLLNNHGPMQFTFNKYWNAILTCHPDSPSAIVGKYKNAWWAHPWDPNARFIPWWAAEETRFNTGWVPVGGETYHLYTWERQVQSCCLPIM